MEDLLSQDQEINLSEFSISNLNNSSINIKMLMKVFKPQFIKIPSHSKIDRIFSVHISSDGQHIISSSRDKTIKCIKLSAHKSFNHASEGSFPFSISLLNSLIESGFDFEHHLFLKEELHYCKFFFPKFLEN